MRTLLCVFLAILFLANFAAAQQNQEPETPSESASQAKPTKRITLGQIDGRHWLIDSEGQPFFAHGITHVNNQKAKLDFVQFATAVRKLGFNAYGYGCPNRLRSDMPFIDSWNHLAPISLYRGKKGIKFFDIFDIKEQKRIEAGVKNVCSRSKKFAHNVIGHCWTDLGAWPLKNPSGLNWVDYIRSLPEDAPGQKAYKKFLADCKEAEKPAEDQAFLRLIAREYFRVVGSANRKHAPDQLIFGDRFAFNTFDPVVLKEMLPWVDGIAIQPPFWAPYPKKKLDEIHELSGKKPIILCDFAIRFDDGDKDIRSWKKAENSVEAGKQYTEYVRAAMDSDYVVGVFWCNPVDTGKGFGKPGVKQGFFGDGITNRIGLHEDVKKLNEYRVEITPKQ